jgi:hypothetical protein
MTRLLTVALLTLAGFAAAAPSASAVPLCVQYVDPIHMGSYQVCPLDQIHP